MTAKKTSKKQSIVIAFMQCVVEQGLSNSSMGEIASKIGIDRSSLYYYFKSRDDLIDALVQYVVEQYIDRLSLALSSFTTQAERAGQLINHLFGSGFHQPDFSSVIDELAALGNREKHISAQVKLIYQAMELAIIKEIDISYPNAAVEHRRWVSYAINQLAEGCTVLTSYGFGSERLDAGRKAAECIIATLATE